MNVLVLSGGSHPYHETTPALSELLGEAGHDVEVTEESGRLVSADTPDWNVLVFNTFRIGEIALAPDERAAMERHIRAGRGFVCVHIASCLPESWDGYHDITGGGWVMDVSHHPPYGELSVNVQKKDHPCAAGIESFVTNDEFYMGLASRPGNDVFLTAEHEGESEPIAWTRSYGNGRVLNISLGHDGRSFQSPEFRRVILNGVSWTTGGR